MDNNTNTTTVAETTQEAAVNAQVDAKSVDGKATITTETVITEPVIEKVDGAFPTSIKPIKAKLEPIRPTAAEMPTITVEVIHVAVFVLITAFIFLSMWNEAKKKA